MELKNINEVTATEVLKLAAALLWDGVSRPITTDRFCCLAVTTAIEQITGLSWGEADDTPLAVNLRKSILGKLDGHGVVEGYMQAQRGLGAEDVTSIEAQAFRKELLGKLLADEYAEKERKEQIEEQIRILEEVKVLRSGNSYFSNFVCWNIDAVMKEKTTPAVCTLKQDIDQYIDGETTVRCWLETRDRREYENDDPVVLNARLKLIDDLLARYRAELAA